jgi:hypothetical protein
MLVVVLANTCDCSFLEVDMAGIKVQGQVALHSKTLSKKVSEVCGECETSTMSHICLVMNIADYCAIDPMTRILLYSICKMRIYVSILWKTHCFTDFRDITDSIP